MLEIYCAKLVTIDFVILCLSKFVHRAVFFENIPVEEIKACKYQSCIFVHSFYVV